MSSHPSSCAACGPVPASHAVLWLANSSDVLALNFQGIKAAAPIRALAQVGEWGLDGAARLLFYAGQALGALALGDDLEKARSRRSRLLWEEARRRSIPMRQLFLFGTPSDLFKIEIDGKTRFFQSIPFPATSPENTLSIDDKVAFKRLMRANGLPVPRSESVHDVKDARRLLADYGTVCVKPQSGSNGRHTYPYVRTEEDLQDALASAKEICARASIEEHLEGNICRATCVDGKLIGFLESYYPTLEGDGVSTIRELITRKNEEKQGGVDAIEMTSSHEGYIRRRGYALHDVLPEGVLLPLTYRAGSGQGGGNREYGRTLHPSFIPIIEQAASLTKLPIVGFDIIIPDPLAPEDSQKWGFIEANSLPWIDLHAAPLYGTPIDLSPAVWDLWK